LAIEWSVLDAQYFGIPQRRRRVFVIAIFDPVLANRSPSPLLPVAESLPGHLTKSKPKRKSAATTLTEGTGTDGAIVNAIGASLYHKQTVVNQDVNAGHLVTEGFTPSSFANYTEGVGTLRSNGGDLGGGSETLVTEPFVKSSRAQTSDDSETWIPGEVNPTLNSFDVGDTRATTAIVEPVAYHFDSLSSNSMKSSNPDSGVNEVDTARTLDTWRPDPSLNQGGLAIVEPVLIDGQRVGDVRIYTEPVQTLGARMGTGGNNVPMLAFGIQGNVVGRQDHNGPAGKGHTEEGDPMFTLTSTDVHAVAYPIDTRNALRDPEKYDAQNRQGLGIGADGDPMATLTSAHVNAVAYDEYNDSTNEVHQALRAGTKQSTGVLIGSEVAATLRSGGDGGVPSSRGEHLVTEPTMAVRRLTPLECERLMGWPDDHTRYKADGTEQADTHRYKQCGNGVASPVAQWIAKHILNI